MTSNVCALFIIPASYDLPKEIYNSKFTIVFFLTNVIGRKQLGLLLLRSERRELSNHM